METPRSWPCSKLTLLVAAVILLFSLWEENSFQEQMEIQTVAQHLPGSEVKTAEPGSRTRFRTYTPSESHDFESPAEVSHSISLSRPYVTGRAASQEMPEGEREIVALEERLKLLRERRDNPGIGPPQESNKMAPGGSERRDKSRVRPPQKLNKTAPGAPNRNLAAGKQLAAPRGGKMHKFDYDGNCNRWNRLSELVVSAEHQFIFCALPGVLDTPWKQIIKRIVGHADWNTKNLKLVHSPLESRLPLFPCQQEQAEALLGNGAPGWAITAMVRDPVTRVLAGYMDLCVGRGEWLRCSDVNSQRSQTPSQNKKGTRVSFAESIRRMAKQSPSRLDRFFRPQHLSCGFQNMTYDIVARYEKMASDSKRLLQFAGFWDSFGTSGWPGNGFLQRRQPGLARRDSPCRFYSHRTLDLLAQVSGDDFGPLFGYDVELWKQHCAPEWDTKNMTVYVYDDPELRRVNRQLQHCYRNKEGVSLWHDERRDRAQDSAEVWLHAYYLQHPNRVMDPAEADFLYFPIYLKHVMHCEHHQDANRWLEPAHKVLLRSAAFLHRPERHVFACQFWQCHIILEIHPKLQQQLARMQMLIHELSKHWMGEKQNSDHTILVPYVAHSWLADYALSVPPMANRTWTLFGQMGGRQKDDDKTKPGGKLRLAMQDHPWAAHNCKYELIDKEHELLLSQWGGTNAMSKTYTEGMLDAKGCLVIRGDSPTTRRLFDAMVAGCVPVIVSDLLWDSLPFRSSIPWKEIAIFVEEDAAEAGIEAFSKILQMTDKQWQSKQDLLLRWSKAVLYGYNSTELRTSLTHFGDVGEMVMESFKHNVLQRK